MTFHNKICDFVECCLSLYCWLKKKEKKGTNLLCNLKGDLIGGTSAAMASLFVGDSVNIRGCCCLKTSTLFPAKYYNIYFIYIYFLQLLIV